jgi:hypothetical protein
VGAWFIGSAGFSELHEVADMWYALGIVCCVGSAVVVHDIGVTSCASGWVVDGMAMSGQQCALVVLMDHFLILFIHSLQPISAFNFAYKK